VTLTFHCGWQPIDCDTTFEHNRVLEKTANTEIEHPVGGVAWVFPTGT
jgi:hypothetical protein